MRTLARSSRIIGTVAVWHACRRRYQHRAKIASRCSALTYHDVPVQYIVLSVYFSHLGDTRHEWPCCARSLKIDPARRTKILVITERAGEPSRVLALLALLGLFWHAAAFPSGLVLKRPRQARLGDRDATHGARVSPFATREIVSRAGSRLVTAQVQRVAAVLRRQSRSFRGSTGFGWRGNPLPPPPGFLFLPFRPSKKKSSVCFAS